MFYFCFKYSFLLLIIFSSAVIANNKLPQLEEILSVADNYHPELQQEQINIQITQTDILKAKSKFIPEYMQRAVIEKNYSYISNELSWQTPFGIELISGIRTGAGDSFIPKDSLTYSHINSSWDSIKKTSVSPFNEDEIKLGFRLPLLNGLLTDENRTNLKLSKIQPSIASLKFQEKRNKLFKNISLQYSDLYFALREYNIYQELLDNLAEQKLFTEKLVKAGSLAPIDLVEIDSQQQQYKIKSLNTLNKFEQAKLELLTNIWSMDSNINNSISLQADIPDYKPEQTRELTDKFSIVKELPQYKLFAYKYKQQKAKEKLAKNNLLPKIDFEMLAVQDLEYLDGEQTSLLGSVNMKLPFVRMQAKAELDKVNLHTKQLFEQQKLLKQSLLNNIESAEISINNSFDKVNLMNKSLDLLEQLLISERKKLQAGLGDMLKINIRLNNLINARLELNKLLKENYNLWIQYKFTTGYYFR